MKLLSNINIALRGIMEFGIVAAFAYWGITSGKNITAKILFGISAPLLLFGIWGVVDFRNAGTISEYLRLAEEIIISGLAAYALFSVGQTFLCWALVSISVVHHALVYLLGQILLK